VRYGKAGYGDATPEEELVYPRIWVNNKCCITSEGSYNPQKHTVVRDVDGTVFAASKTWRGGMRVCAFTGVPGRPNLLCMRFVDP
jgi:hypothetical protein